MMFNWTSFSNHCAKVLLLVINVICIVIAACTFGFAVVDTRILKQYGEEHAAGTFAGDMIIIAATLLLVGVASFGCVAILKNNVKMLYLYVGLLIIIVILELLIAIFVAINRYGLELKVTDWLREEFYRNVTEEDKEQHMKLWDEIQLEYKCCGLNGPEDYTALCKEISMSCCPWAYGARTTIAQKQLYDACVASVSYYLWGCEDEIIYTLRSEADNLFRAAVISFCCEAAAIILAMSIANRLKNCVQVYKHTVKY